MRLQLALNVYDLDEAVDYYTKLFNTTPHKRRPGYANFALNSPPLKLALFENPNAAERLNHVGIEVMDSETLAQTQKRLTAVGLLDQVQQDETCCHATQDKLWSYEPQGLQWDWYRITDDNPNAEESATASACCDLSSATARIAAS